MVTLNLSTSDWVAIIMGVTQLAASVALAAWTIRGTAPATSQMLASSPRSKPWPFLWAWIKSSWPFLLFFSYACHEVWSLAVGPDELSKSLVLRIVLYSAYGVLNAVASVGFFVVLFQFDLLIRLAEVVQKLNQAHGQSFEVQKKSLAITERLLAEKKPTKRRTR
jgi:hypothetical protein